MFSASLLNDVKQFEHEFARCCREYKSLSIATAWCGDPRHVLPYAHLKSFTGKLETTIGISFNQTHPDGIEFFLSLKANVRIFKTVNGLFHPKVYLFSAGKRVALFVGSSNLTHNGFLSNIEANVLLEGIPQQREQDEIRQLRDRLSDWHSPPLSFVPTPRWLRRYRKSFVQARAIERKSGVLSPAREEEESSFGGWLRAATWDIYLEKVFHGLELTGRTVDAYKKVLDSAHRLLPVPWRMDYFENKERRRIILGVKGYGLLGHVAASGRFARLIANGPKQAIASSLTRSMRSAVWHRRSIGTK